MRVHNLSLPLFIVAAVMSFGPISSYADGKSIEQANQPTTRQNDPRLPAVLPGEEVVTESGQRMRVWSSAGPVPVNPRPTPQTLQGNNGYGGPSVIVDGRFDPRGAKGPSDRDPAVNQPVRAPGGVGDDFPLSQPHYPKASQHIDVR